jgi:hypothetical protein
METVPIRTAWSSHPTSHPTTLPTSRPDSQLVEADPSLVPIRTRRASPSARVDHRAAFILMHIDGTMDVPAIARLVGLPVDEVRACFDELIASGLVELGPRRPPPPESGVFACLSPR